MKKFIFSIILLFICLSVAHADEAFDVGFSPGNSLNVIIDAINSADHSVLVAAYAFTSKPIATALLDAHNRGIIVQVVVDAKSNTDKHSAVTFLANQGVSVRVNNRYAIFNHKFMLFDNRHVQTGSFNYSAAAAEKNAENVLLLRNVPKIHSAYFEEWVRLLKESEEVKLDY